MPLHKLSQKSFVNGQYDRTAQNQESVSGGNIVASGLSYAKNVLSSDRGELRKRLGTKFLKQLSKETVIVPFRLSDDNDVILLCDNSKIHGYNYNDGELSDLMSVGSTSAVPFPANNTWSDGTQATNNITNGDWKITFSWATSGTPYYPGWIINGGGWANQYGEKTHDGYNLSANDQAPQSFVIYNSNTACCLRNIKFWFYHDSQNGYEYGSWLNPIIQYSDDGSTWTGVLTNIQISDYQNWGHWAARLPYPERYVTRCAATVSQSNYSGNHKYWRIYFQSYQSAANAVKIDSVSFVNVGVVQVFEVNSPYTADQLKQIKYSQENNQMFIACEGVQLKKLLNNTGEFTFTNHAPAGSPMANNNYPASVTLFQNRLWVAGFDSDPTSVVASKFGDYGNFTASNPLQKDDYLQLRSNSQLKSKISNIVGGQKVLYCFSQDGISMINGGATGLIATNENIEFILKNRMPAGNATPAFKDDVMLYSSSDGTKLYGLDFDLLVDRFQVSDLAKYAKDITKAKITELHYVNNESKLVYGLTEEGFMFALLYEKGQYQGFFPLDFNGTVYDICPIKEGRDYKLLMVVFREGNWYLEEKLDAGNYIDTSKPRMTGEEKKWATYDNLENNIALDCYQTYDLGFSCNISIYNENTITSDVDLSSYPSIMLGNPNSKDFMIVNIGEAQSNTQYLYQWVAPSVTKVLKIRLNYTVGMQKVYCYRNTQYDSSGKYGWTGSGGIKGYTTVENPQVGDRFYFTNGGSGSCDIDKIFTTTLAPDVKYTDTTNPVIDSLVYDSWDNEYSQRVQSVGNNFIVIPDASGTQYNRQYNRDSTGDLSRVTNYVYNIDIITSRGDTKIFTMAYPAFVDFQPNLPYSSSVGVISEGRYFNALPIDSNGYVTLPLPCYRATYGIIYESVAILKIQTPYESLKNVAQVDISVIDTTHLEIGTAFSDTENIEKIDDSSYYDLTRITMNDIYRQVISDTPETTKSIILRSNKGVPFTVIAVDVYISYSNLGGD